MDAPLSILPDYDAVGYCRAGEASGTYIASRALGLTAARRGTRDSRRQQHLWDVSFSAPLYVDGELWDEDVAVFETDSRTLALLSTFDIEWAPTQDISRRALRSMGFVVDPAAQVLPLISGRGMPILSAAQLQELLAGVSAADKPNLLFLEREGARELKEIQLDVGVIQAVSELATCLRAYGLTLRISPDRSIASDAGFDPWADFREF